MARLDDVTWRARAEPLRVEAFVRRIPALADRDPTKDYDPIGSLLGTPDRHPSWGGEFVALDGYEVDRPCTDSPPDPEARRDDLVLVVTAPRAGAAVESFSVIYAVDGRRNALDVAWAMALCGPAVSKDLCPDPPGARSSGRPATTRVRPPPATPASGTSAR